MPDLTWKGVFLIWLLAMPMVGGVGWVIKQRDPVTYAKMEKTVMSAYQTGMKTVQNFQKKDDKKLASAKGKKAASNYNF